MKWKAEKRRGWQSDRTRRQLKPASRSGCLSFGIFFEFAIITWVYLQIRRLAAERKQIEAALHDLNNFRRAILDSANFSIISTRMDGIITFFNKAAEQWLGYSADEMVGKVTPKVIHDPQEVALHAEVLSHELGITIEPGFEVFVAKARLGTIEEQEWTYIRKDGSRFPVRLSVTALRDTEGKISGFLGIASDITERKQMDVALRESEQRLALAVQAGNIGLFDHDQVANRLYWSPTMYRLQGKGEEEVASIEGYVSAIHQEDRETVLAKIMRAHDPAGDGVFAVEHRLGQTRRHNQMGQLAIPDVIRGCRTRAARPADDRHHVRHHGTQAGRSGVAQPEQFPASNS